jgi:catechol 2,3-dioxygenase-like lactoylglutathione lyase family enzyme
LWISSNALLTVENNRPLVQTPPQDADVPGARITGSGDLAPAQTAATSSNIPDMLATPLSPLQIRVARPTARLQQVVAFYRDGLGLPVIGHFENHAGYSGVMLGIPTETFHLEFTSTNEGSECPAPTKDNLLVLYMPDPNAYQAVVNRLRAHGYTPVEPENPYWKSASQTFEDPDGWRVVVFNGPAFRNS